MVPLNWYLLLAAFIFCCGLYAALARRNAIAALMGIELMLNAVNINLLAFWRHGEQVARLEGQTRALRVTYGIGREGDANVLRRTCEDLSIDVATGVLRMTIEYADNGTGDWVRGWSKPGLPAAARVSLTLADENRIYEQVVRKTVFTINVD